MPASSRTSQSSAWTRASSPFQNEQNGSRFGSPGSPGTVSCTCPHSSVWCATIPLLGASHTRSTSQSVQCVNPSRYSVPQVGQNISILRCHAEIPEDEGIHVGGQRYGLRRIARAVRGHGVDTNQHRVFFVTRCLQRSRIFEG